MSLTVVYRSRWAFDTVPTGPNGAREVSSSGVGIRNLVSLTIMNTSAASPLRRKLPPIVEPNQSV